MSLMEDPSKRPTKIGEDDTASEAVSATNSTDEDGEFCIACVTSFPPGKLVELRCGDSWCGDCVESIFTEAMRDETSYPPRCCYPISLKVVQRYLPRTLVRQFQAKQLELSTKNKTYCHKPNCSTFIAPQSIHNDQAICQQCRSRTCTKCRAEWHFGPCSGGDDPDFMVFAESKHWKRCPQCRRMVEREDGCSHMV